MWVQMQEGPAQELMAKSDRQAGHSKAAAGGAIAWDVKLYAQVHALGRLVA